MTKSIIVEGRTTNDAIEKGLKELGVSKEKVEIKVLENEEKRSFFNILTPRIVKVELTLKKDIEENSFKIEEKKTEKKVELKPEVKERIKANLEEFLKDFISKINNIEYEISLNEDYFYIILKGEEVGKLIGYRGETLNSMQTILSAIANKQSENKVRVILDIEGYREKRKKALEELADKLTRTVINTGKQVTLEPMSAYERKIIHNRLQDSKRVKTYSIGEEPYRKVVITKKQ